MIFDIGSAGILSGGNKLPDKAHKFLSRVLASEMLYHLPGF